MGPSIYNILVLVAGIIIYMITTTKSRQMQDKAFQKLDDEQRKIVYTAFAPFRRYNLIFPALLLILYILFFRFKVLPVLALNIGLAIIYIIYTILTLLYIRRKLIKLEISSDVVFSVLMGLLVQYLGIIFVIVAIVIYFYLKKLFL